MKKVTLGLALMLLVAPVLEAWGPITHMYINRKALDGLPGDSILNDPFNQVFSLKHLFITSAPTPDVNELMSGFPRSLHSSETAIGKLIKRAIDDGQFGKQDIAMAMGWAGHYWGENQTAHKMVDGSMVGYPNTKLLFKKTQHNGANHDILELLCDIYVLQICPETKGWVSQGPRELLTVVINEEHEKKVTEADIKNTINVFSASSVGAKSITNHLVKYRGGLVREITAFLQGDLPEQLQKSANEVRAGVLEKWGRGIQKTRNATADSVFADSGNGLERIKQAATVKGIEVLMTKVVMGILGKVQKIVDSRVIQWLIRNTRKGREMVTEIEKFVEGKMPAEKGTAYAKVMSRFVVGMLVYKDKGLADLAAYAENY